MDKHEWTGILIILGIVAMGLYGSSMKSKGFSLFPASTSTVNVISNETRSQNQIQTQIRQTETKVDELKKQLEEEEAKKLRSKYYGLVSISYVSRYSDASKEYVMLRVNASATTIPVTGWLLKSSSGQSINIPKASYVYFTGMQNSEDDIVLEKNDSLYLMTGTSPVSASFKVNRCSGYLQQFQKFYPSLSYSCPLPKDEDMSSIPQTVNNDACISYIESYQGCSVPTDNNIPANWSYECRKFIQDKINYPSCVNIHKNDKDFYKHEWRVYLKRSARLWKDTRETITLYDNEGKIVSTYSY